MWSDLDDPGGLICRRCWRWFCQHIHSVLQDLAAHKIGGCRADVFVGAEIALDVSVKIGRVQSQRD
jgi:hypothetical protein